MKKNITDTSLEAYATLYISKAKSAIEVLTAIDWLSREFGDCTDYEITKYLNKSDPNYVRPRRYELVNKLKLVQFSSKRLCKITGKTALAWKPIEKFKEVQNGRP